MAVQVLDIYAVNGIVYCYFTTNNAAGAAVAPSGAFGTDDIILYKDGSNVQRSSASGWTVTSPFDSLTGLHFLSIDTSDNTDAGFYATGHVYTIVLSPNETVDSQTVISVLGHFKIGPTDANTIQVLGTAVTAATAGVQDVNASRINNVATTSVTTINANQGTTQPVNFTGTAGSALVKGDAIDINSVAASSVTTIAANLGTTQPVNFTGTAGAALVKGDTIDVGGTAQTAGDIIGGSITRSGTAQSGAVTNIKLDAGASATNNIYNGQTIFLTGGTGAGQARVIASYNGGTKVAIVDRPFQTAPDNTTTFVIRSTDAPALNGSLQVTSNAARTVIASGTAQAGSTSNTIKLASTSLATNNIYNNCLIALTGGTGQGQTRTIIAYDGTTKIATVDQTWVTTPDATTTYDVYASTTDTLFSNVGVAQAGAASTLTLAATASSVNNIYNGSILTILSGTDAGDTSVITAYNGATKVATVSPAWAVTPDNTSAYAVIPNASAVQPPAAPTVAEIAAAILTNPSNRLTTNAAGYVTTTSPIKKNTALSNFIFPMTDDVNHELIAGLAVSGFVKKDNGAFGATPAVTGLGNGLYSVDLTAANMNGDVVTLRFTAVGADDKIITIFPQS